MEFQLRRIRCLRDAKRYDECLSLCEELTLGNPSDSRPLYEQACVYALLRDLSAALEAIRQAQRLSPEEPAFAFFAGLWNLKLGDLASAVSDLNFCLELEVNHSDQYYLRSARFLRAVAHLKLDDAEAVLLDCAELPDDFSMFVERLYSVADLRREALHKSSRNRPR